MAWMGPLRDCVAAEGGCAWATAWRSEDARGTSIARPALAAGTAGGMGGVGALGDGRRYIASIVGRRAAPKGVDRKSLGRSDSVVSGMQTTKTKGQTFDEIWD